MKTKLTTKNGSFLGRLISTVKIDPFPKVLHEEKHVKKLNQLAYDAYRAVKGSGCGRVDVRQDKKSEEFSVLEENSIPKVLEPSSVKDILAF